MKKAGIKKISIIIPVYNDFDRLKLCLNSLNKQSCEKNLFEVIIIDNNSQIPVISLLKNHSFNFELKILQENKVGSYCARNKGIKIAKGKILGFTDSDCIPDKNWISMGFLALQKTPNSIIGGNVILKSKNIQKNVYELYEEFNQSFSQKNFIEESHYSVTANLFTSKFLFEKYGLFNENLKSSGDKEWCNRIYKNNINIIYDPKIIVFHPTRDSLKKILNKTLRLAGGSENLFSLYKNKTSIELLNALSPPILKFIKKLFDKNIVIEKKVRVLTLWFFLQCVERFERLRIKIGGKTKR